MEVVMFNIQDFVLGSEIIGVGLWSALASSYQETPAEVKEIICKRQSYLLEFYPKIWV